MLVREQRAIENAVFQAYNNVVSEQMREHAAKLRTIAEKFKDDPEVLDLAAALDKHGCRNGKEAAYSILMQQAGSYGRININMDSHFVERVTDAQKAIGPQPTGYHGSATQHLLSIATNSTRKKWDAIEGGVYLLISDLQRAKTTEEIDAIVKAFCKTLAA